MTAFDLRCPECQAGNHPHDRHPCDCPCTDVVPF